jgi:RNase P protein component
MRPLLPQIIPGWDLILIARPALSASSLQEIRQALISLLRRAQIMHLSNGS